MKILSGLILSLFLLVSAAQAQQPTPTPVEEDCGLTSPELVTLNVSVWSKNKGYLKDLNDKNFEVFNGKDKQPIEFFKQADEPVSVGVLFDFSDSMSSSRLRLTEIPFAVEGLIAFINASHAKNEYFIIPFAGGFEVLLEPTQNKKEIENALKTLVTYKPRGNTSVYDAMSKGFEKISGGKFAKKVLLLISDGVDTGSKKSNFAEIKKQAMQNSNVMIYMVNIISDRPDGSLEYLQSEAWSEALTEKSGGRILYPQNRGEIIAAFELLAEELKSQYRIGFLPQNPDAEKDWHEIKVNLNLPKETNKEAGKISVRAQKGLYF